VQVKRLIRKRIRKAGSGIDLAADVDAVVSVNVNEHRQEPSETRTTSPPSEPGGADGPDNRGRKNT
jgi:hypothetical protein